MTDLREKIATRYERIGKQGQIELLAKIADKLTLLARDTYDLNGGVADSPLPAFNEARHRILAQLLRLLTDDERRYPDRVFTNILIDHFAMVRLDPAGILHALHRTPTAPFSLADTDPD